jgi:hypothetical protein
MGIILVAEDIPEEQIKAKEVVLKSGNRPVISGTLEDVTRLWDKLGERISGILTDIHFPEWEGSKDNNPSGLAVVIRAVQEGLPVSICSDINHHFTLYLRMVVDGLKELTGQEIPFTMDKKDWQVAMDGLKKIQEKKGAKE